MAREIAAIDLACSRFRPDSELAGVNRQAGDRVVVSSLFLAALRAALRGATLSGGLVDPTVGRSLRILGYDRDIKAVRQRGGAAVVPRFEAVPGWTCIEIDGSRSTVRIPRGVELDLGATGKAFAADRAAAAACASTGCGVLVALGGDIAVAGAPPPGGWPVRVADDHAAPLDGDGPVVAISSGGVATSSTVLRRWRTAAGPMHHIVDPTTGRPAGATWRTVTVAAGSATDANTASTAAVILGEDAPAWLAERGLPARLVRPDGTISRVGAWPEERT